MCMNEIQTVRLFTVHASPEWMNTGVWTVDLGGVPHFSDDDGWTYGFNMTAFNSFESLGAKVKPQYHLDRCFSTVG